MDLPVPLAPSSSTRRGLSQRVCRFRTFSAWTLRLQKHGAVLEKLRWSETRRYSVRVVWHHRLAISFTCLQILFNFADTNFLAQKESWKCHVASRTLRRAVLQLNLLFWEKMCETDEIRLRETALCATGGWSRCTYPCRSVM